MQLTSHAERRELACAHIHASSDRKDAVVRQGKLHLGAWLWAWLDGIARGRARARRQLEAGPQTSTQEAPATAEHLASTGSRVVQCKLDAAAFLANCVRMQWLSLTVHVPVCLRISVAGTRGRATRGQGDCICKVCFMDERQLAPQPTMQYSVVVIWLAGPVHCLRSAKR